MCTKAEVSEIISAKIDPVEKSIIRIEKRLDKMPCQDLLERTIRLEIHQETAEKERKILFTQQRDTDKQSFNKLWTVVIAIGGSALSAVTAIIVYKITRG